MSASFVGFDLALSELNDLIALDRHRLKEDAVYSQRMYDMAVRCVAMREHKRGRDPSLYFDYLGSKLHYVDPKAIRDTTAARAEQDFHHINLSFRSMTQLYAAWQRSPYYYGIKVGKKGKRPKPRTKTCSACKRSKHLNFDFSRKQRTKPSLSRMC